MIQCPSCRIWYVNSTLFCAECGSYLARGGNLATDPLDESRDRCPTSPAGTPSRRSQGRPDCSRAQVWSAVPGEQAGSETATAPDSGPLTIRLRVNASRTAACRPPFAPRLFAARNPGHSQRGLLDPQPPAVGDRACGSSDIHRLPAVPRDAEPISSRQSAAGCRPRSRTVLGPPPAPAARRPDDRREAAHPGLPSDRREATLSRGLAQSRGLEGEGEGAPARAGQVSSAALAGRPSSARLGLAADTPFGREARDTPFGRRDGGADAGRQAHEMEISLARPIRLGRADPIHHIFPEIDLAGFRGMEQGVSREHACIVRRGDSVEIQDLASTNGTLLNGRRLAPYAAATLKDGDRLQLGKLLIEVGITTGGRRRTNDE